MKIDQHPFPTNMVEVNGKAKVLTSQLAKASGAIDPEVQISAEEVKGKRPIEEAECSKGTQHPVTSQMLLNKFQRQHEEARHEEEMIRRHKDHWRCPFFIYCWEEGIKLPSANNCPECNRLFWDSKCFKRTCFDDRK
jgi:hypothetical protein